MRKKKREYTVLDAARDITQRALQSIFTPHSSRVLYAISKLSSALRKPEVDEVAIADVANVRPLELFLDTLHDLRANELIYRAQKDSGYAYGLTPMGESTLDMYNVLGRMADSGSIKISKGWRGLMGEIGKNFDDIDKKIASKYLK